MFTLKTAFLDYFSFPFSISKIICFYSFEKQRERIFYPLGHFPHAHCSQHHARLELGPQNWILVSRWVAGTRVLNLISCCSGCSFSGSCEWEWRQDWSSANPVWDEDVPNSVLPCSPNPYIHICNEGCCLVGKASSQ